MLTCPGNVIFSNTGATTEPLKRGAQGFWGQSPISEISIADADVEAVFH